MRSVEPDEGLSYRSPLTRHGAARRGLWRPLPSGERWEPLRLPLLTGSAVAPPLPAGERSPVGFATGG